MKSSWLGVGFGLKLVISASLRPLGGKLELRLIGGLGSGLGLGLGRWVSARKQ